MQRITLLAISLLLLVTAAFAKTTHADPRAHPTLALSNDAPRAWEWREGRRVDDNGITLAWYGIGEATSAGPVEASAEEFVRRHEDKFGGAEVVEGLELVSVKESRGAHHVVFHQTMHGLRVYRAELRVHLSRDGMVNAATSTLFPHAPLTNDRSYLSITEARTRAAELIGGESRRAEPPAERMVYIDLETGEATLAWVVNYASVDPLGSWELVLDASTGKLLRLDNHLFFIDGEGLVYNPDPITTAEANYGDPGFTDDDDNASPELNAERVQVTLREITFLDIAYWLEGPYVRIVDFMSPDIAPVSSPTPAGFSYTRDQSGFEDVNAYYHIDEMQRHIRNLGFVNLFQGPIEVDPHGGTWDNSFYDPEFDQIAYGTGGVDDAEDADILWHEYGHALQVYAAGFEGATSDARRMYEGLSDYWAATMSARLSDYQDDRIGNWDGHNEFWDGRYITTDDVYPDDWPGLLYEAGTIWAHALWLMRADLDPDDADAIVAQSLYYTQPGLIAPDFAAGLLQAEQDLFDGQYHDIVFNALDQKGFVYPYGTLAGTVTDELSGDPVFDAKVVVQCDPPRTGWTGGNGGYLLPLIPEGVWDVSFSADGYLTETLTAAISVDQTTTLDVVLSPVVASVTLDSLNLHAYIGQDVDSSFAISSFNDPVYFIVRADPVGVEPVQPYEPFTQIQPMVPEGEIQDMVFLNDRFYLVHNAAGNNNRIVVLDTDGMLVRSFAQPANLGLPFRGITADDEFLYSIESNTILKYDTLGVLQDVVESVHPVNEWLAYDDVSGWLWCARSTGEVTAYDQNAGEIWPPVDTGLELTGIGYDIGREDRNSVVLLANPPDGPPAVHFFHPGYFELSDQSVTLAPSDAATTGAAVFTGMQWPLDYRYFASLVDEGNGTRIQLYSIRWTVPWADTDPEFGLVYPWDTRTVQVRANTEHLDTGLHEAMLNVFFPDGGMPLELPLTLNITAVDAGDAGGTTALDAFTVSQPSPNPCNAATVLTLTLPHAAEVKLAVYDVLGRQVDQFSRRVGAGEQRITWTPAPGLASGVYLLRVGVDGMPPAVRKVVVVK